MKHKRGEHGFAPLLILLLIALIAIIGLMTWNLTARHSNRNSDQSAEPNYVPGQVNVTFKDGITADQAVALMKSYNAKVYQDKTLLDSYFTPVVTEFYLDVDLAAQATKVLNNDPLVANLDS